MLDLRSTSVAVALSSAAFIWLDWSRFVSDFWPLDKSSVGPNLVASVVQWAIILVAASLIYPPTRRAIDKYVKRHFESVKAHVTSGHNELHAKLDHIIYHSNDIPPFVKNGNGSERTTDVTSKPDGPVSL